ncbi:MAG: hypothetical protein HQK69_04865 [Desulfamplus sp.]|nr:hypothetical protein [Desulfamplus sp.]
MLPFFLKKMTKIIAHRGARSIAPENTVAAAEIARMIGADLWETDISVTRDGHLVLFHDDDLLRTTNAKFLFPYNKSFLLDTFDLAQIQKLDIGRTFIERDPFNEIALGNISLELLHSFRGIKIPTLEDALIYTQKNNFPVNLELKEQSGKFRAFPLPKAVANMINKMRINYKLLIISSFKHEWLEEIKDILPDIEVQALLGDDVNQKIDWDKFCSADNNNLLQKFDTYNINSQMITIDEIAKLKKIGKKVNIFTVNDKDDMVRFIKAGVDGIFTDYPQVMKQVR